MSKINFSAAAARLICGAAWLAAMAWGTAIAADLPITKAPPKIPDSGSLFWAEVDYLA
jgi:hypothetical protein